VKWTANPTSDRPRNQQWRTGPIHSTTPGHSADYPGSLIVLSLAAFLALPFIPDFFSTETMWTLGEQRVYLWAMCALLLAAILFLLGLHSKGVWFGALLNRENKLDLTRLQLVVWSIILLSAIHVALFSNLVSSSRLDLAIPPEVWVLLGIEIATFTSSSIILGTKRDLPPPTQRVAARHGVLVIDDGFGSQKLVVSDGSLEVIGVLVANTQPRDWSWSNLFLGAELGNERSVDVGKVQMFFFSAMVFTAYSALLIQTFLVGSIPLDSLPGFSASVLTVLAISHAGYLINLAVPHTDSDHQQIIG
jgi:hypothetical protein